MSFSFGQERMRSLRGRSQTTSLYDIWERNILFPSIRVLSKTIRPFQNSKTRRQTFVAPFRKLLIACDYLRSCTVERGFCFTAWDNNQRLCLVLLRGNFRHKKNGTFFWIVPVIFDAKKTKKETFSVAPIENFGKAADVSFSWTLPPPVWVRQIL